MCHTAVSPAIASRMKGAGAVCASAITAMPRRTKSTIAEDEPAPRPVATLSLRTSARPLVGYFGAGVHPHSAVDRRAAAPDAGVGGSRADRKSRGAVHVSGHGGARRGPRGDGRLVRPAVWPAAPRSRHSGAAGERYARGALRDRAGGGGRVEGVTGGREPEPVLPDL